MLDWNFIAGLIATHAFARTLTAKNIQTVNEMQHAEAVDTIIRRHRPAIRRQRVDLERATFAIVPERCGDCELRDVRYPETTEQHQPLVDGGWPVGVVL